MRQSKLESLAESSVNVVSGFFVSWMVWQYLIPVFWPHLATSGGTSVAIIILFTIASMARQYIWRRFFERDVHQAIINLFRGRAVHG